MLVIYFECLFDYIIYEYGLMVITGSVLIRLRFFYFLRCQNRPFSTLLRGHKGKGGETMPKLAAAPFKEPTKNKTRKADLWCPYCGKN
jgi:hypothetical protein